MANRRAPRTKSGKVETTYHRDYQIGQDYDGLLRALNESYERQGRHRVRLANFKQLTNDGSAFRLYLVPGTLDKLSPPLREGWVVEPAGDSPRATISRVDGDRDELTVRCEGAKPGQRFNQELGFSAPDFLKRLRDWIELKTGRPLPKLLEILEAQSRAHSSFGPDKLESSVVQTLREAQLSAVSSLGSGILKLWGPPGTGKTYTVARAVQTLVHQGFKVALLAPTNVAVDTATLAVQRAFEDSGQRLPGGALLRCGYPALEELENHPELLAWQESLKQQQEELAAVRLEQRETEKLLRRVPRAESYAVEGRIEELKRQQETILHQRGEELWGLVEQAQIVATTIYTGLHRPEMTRFFSCQKVAVVIDEAGMVPRYVALPLLELLGGGEAPQGTLKRTPAKVTMAYAGDPMQLAPISHQINEKDVNLRYWMGESLMEELLTDRSAPNVRVLDEQSRMDPQICQRISDTYYQGILKTLQDPDRPRPPLAEGWPTQGLILVDGRKAALPSDAPKERLFRQGKKSNERILQVAVRLIREALAGKAKSVLWLTTFREQAMKAEQLVNLHFSDANVRAGTVHSSQGSEADLVIFDPVLVHHRWMRGLISGDLNIERLLNVAVSRGRGQVIVLASQADIQKNDLFRRLLGQATVWDGGMG